MSELKKHLSLSDQADKLMRRGLIIDNKSEVESSLFSINYYRLSGYLHSFKKPGTDNYIEGISFKRLMRIYAFDRKFTRILMFALEDIEETLKTRFSYTITGCHPDDPTIYLKPTIYREYAPYVRFLGYFYREVENNKGLPFVKHHIEHYDGLLPMWVAVELFTMGNLHALYNNLLPKYQKMLAKAYGTGPTQLSSWIENLTYTRNHLAHYMRIYEFNFGRTPAKCKNHVMGCPTSQMIFDQIFIISCMYSDIQEWNNYVLPEIKAILEEYTEEVSLTSIGFPENWESILTK